MSRLGSGNGGDHEDLDVAAQARQRATKIAAVARERGDDPGVEVGATALAEAALIKRHYNGVQTVLAELYGQYGTVVGSTGRLADAAKQGLDEVRDEMRIGFVKLGAILATHADRADRVSDDRDQRIAVLEASVSEIESRSAVVPPIRRQLASITNELDQVEDTGVRNMLREARAHDVVVLEQMKSEIAALKQSASVAEKARHDAEIVASALAADADKRDADSKEKEADADKREERWKRRFGLLLAAAALLTLVGGAVLWTWAFAAKHPPAEILPAPATK